jgi:hypothetical protein
MFTFVQKMCVLPRMCFLVTASIGLYAQSTPTVPATETRTSGMVGVVDGEVARVNVLNPGDSGAVCTGTINFFDGAGNLLKTGPVIVLPGQSQFLDVFGDKDLALTGATRREVRGTITTPAVVPVSSATPTTPTACRLIGTLEVFDETTGRTLALLGLGHKESSSSVSFTTANP